VDGFVLLKLNPSVRYRGIDREPFEPRIIENELSVEVVSDTKDIWAMYPDGWRRDAYRLFSENQSACPEDVAFLKSGDVAQAILRLIPPSMGQYEVIHCRVLPSLLTGTEIDAQSERVLGYDVAYLGGDYYSAVRNGLHVNPHSELISKHLPHLNEYGLFFNPQHVAAFLNDFRNLVLSEKTSSFVIYELSAV